MSEIKELFRKDCRNSIRTYKNIEVIKRLKEHLIYL